MYVKLFISMYEGSMIGAGASVFAVWPYILARADNEGWVEVNPALVAVLIGMTTEEVAGALKYLMSPDPNSRSQEEEGKRLVYGGRSFLYRIVNYERYRRIRDAEDRKEQNREANRRYREKRRMINIPDHHDGEKRADLITNDHGDGKRANSAHAEAEAEAKPPYIPPQRGGTKKPKKLTRAEIKAAKSSVGASTSPPPVRSWTEPNAPEWARKYGELIANGKQTPEQWDLLSRWQRGEDVAPNAG